MSRPIPADLEAQIRWRNEHPSAPQSHEWGITDRRVLLVEVKRLRALVQQMEWQPTLFAVPITVEMTWQPRLFDLADVAAGS